MIFSSTTQIDIGNQTKPYTITFAVDSVTRDQFVGVDDVNFSLGKCSDLPATPSPPPAFGKY